MNNYPPGMTSKDWQHIDGEQHYRQCPVSEDYSHDCSKDAAEYLRPEFSPPCWVLAVRIATFDRFRYLRVDFCPWCGEDLGRPECICRELAQDMKDDAAEHKAEEQP